jgi:DNA-binding transcriptional MerR regulator
MRISELSSATNVPVATIKYYLREKLLPEGQRTSATQASYTDAHIERLRVIRALVDSGVGIAGVRRVVAALDAPPDSAYDLLGEAHAAVTPLPSVDADPAEAERLVARIGWYPGACTPEQLAAVARALDTLAAAGFEIPAETMDVYLDSVRAIAEVEIAHVPTESPADAVRYVVLGTALVEPLLLALRRVAEQVVAAERFG